MLSILNKFGLSSDFVCKTKDLYTNIRNQVIVNHLFTDPSPVSHSVRQDCGLSPALFALCIETLANRIRTNILIKGKDLPRAELKVSLYADDTTVLVRDGPFAQHVIDTFKTYESASGLSLNLNKSSACIMAGRLYPDLTA
jgi:hypothetical protein